MAEAKHEARRKGADPESTWGANEVRKQQWQDSNGDSVRTATEKANKDKEAGDA